MSAGDRALRLFMVAGEHSGDQLGGRLIRTIRKRAGGRVVFSGVGGAMMEAEGCPSLFPLGDIAVMGPLDILPRLPTLIRRVYRTVDAVCEARPDALVILDSPEFTHPVAKRVKERLPRLPVIDYVSPSVWAWRPGRARRMRRYIDHVMAILPFEPAAHAHLGGPNCTYVGHPLIERLGWINSLEPRRLAAELKLARGKPVIVVLPGSRPNEARRLMRPFGEALGLLQERIGPFEVIVPAVNSVRTLIEERLAGWPLRPHLVEGDTRKFQAFRLARAALAASGTVTLELALSGTPMAVAYLVDPPTAFFLRRLVKVPSIVLPNLILEENAFPEFVQGNCTGEKLADAVAPLIRGGREREQQEKALSGLAKRMTLPKGLPSEKAAGIVLRMAKRGAGG